MKILTQSNITFFIVSISTLLIGFGWAFQNANIALIGAITYLTAIASDLVHLIVSSKKFKKGEEIVTSKKSIDKFTRIVEGVLVISALIATISEDSLYRTPGIIIWIGQVIMFTVYGPIIEIFTGIPMQMTYGGWRTRRFFRGRK